MASISVRRYDGFTPDAVPQIIQRLEEVGWAETVRSITGFIHYSILDDSDTTIATISVFETQAGVEESDRLAAELVRSELADLQPTPAQITEGEVIFDVAAE